MSVMTIEPEKKLLHDKVYFLSDKIANWYAVVFYNLEGRRFKWIISDGIYGDHQIETGSENS